jgi:hypothetical protein
VPRVRWETHTDPVQIPVVQRQVVPQTMTVKVPVTTQRFVAEEHTSKVAVAIKPGASFGSTGPAPLASSGGVHLDSDPPRSPTGTAWKPADQK